jgi:cobalamin biosynthesis protein CobD/CbiB
MPRQRPHEQHGWTSAFPEERCNFHPARPACTVYGGTPLCAMCEHRVRDGADEDAARAGRRAS